MIDGKDTSIIPPCVPKLFLSRCVHVDSVGAWQEPAMVEDKQHQALLTVDDIDRYVIKHW